MMMSRSSNQPGRKAKQGRLAVLLSVLVLAACAGSPTPAPISDRSVALERSDPVIAPPGGGPDVPAPAGRGRATGSGASQGGSAASSSAAVAVNRPPASSEGATARSAAVSAVNLGGGIARAPIGRVESTQEPARSAPASPTTSSSTVASAGNLSAAAVSGSSEGQRATQLYTVARGDTLFSIAFMHDVDYRRLALANNLSPPYTIHPGQQLLLTEGSIDDQTVASMPAVPPAPAGELAGVTIGERAVEAEAGRRSGDAPTRNIEGIAWSWPASGRVVSNFAGTGHRGIDIAGGAGDSVYAVADGDVVYAGRGIQGTGNLVILRHSARHLSAYMHNRSVAVSEGERVLAGDKVAEMGQGPDGSVSLHFEIRVDGQPADPTRYLPSR